MSSEVKIDHIIRLKKLENLRDQACNEIKSIIFQFNDDKYNSQLILGKIENSLSKMKELTRIEIHFNRNGFSGNISSTITQIFQNQNNLTQFQLRFFGSPLSEDAAYNIYKIIHSWVFKNDGNIREVLFQNEALVLWRCPSYKNVYLQNKSALQTFIEELTTTQVHSPKYIVEILLNDIDLSKEDITSLVSALQFWKHLKHFQLFCNSISPSSINVLLQSLNSLPQLQSCLVYTHQTGLLTRKGVTLKLDAGKNQLEVINDSFYFNLDVIRYIFNRELKPQNVLAMDQVTIQSDFSNPSIQKRFRELALKHLMSNISQMQQLRSLNLSLSRNELGIFSGEPIGKALDQMKKVERFNLDLNENHLGANGFFNLISPIIQSNRRFKSISLNLNRNLISNEGALHLITLLSLHRADPIHQQQPSMLELTQFQRVQANQIQFKGVDVPRKHNLEFLQLDLSNNRLSSDILDRLMENISVIPSLQSIQLKLTGNIIAISKLVDFSQLKQLRALGLTFWCNDFSDESLYMIFRSMRSITPQLEELEFNIISNNVHDDVLEFSGHLDHLVELQSMRISYSENGEKLTRLIDFDLTLIALRNLVSVRLDLSSCNFGAIGVAEISKNIQYFQQLEVLDLNFASNKPFDDECASRILEALPPLYVLQTLKLNYQATSITDLSIKAISDFIRIMLSLRSVTFNFQKNNTTNLAMKSLVAGLISSPHIQNPQFLI